MENNLYPKYLVLDIGGSLNKVCFISEHNEKHIPHIPQLTITQQNHSIYFIYFKQIQQLFHYINTYFNAYHRISVTGGGCFKYKNQLKQLNKQIVEVQEFQSLIEGLNFFQQSPDFQQFVATNVEIAKQLNYQSVAFKSLIFPLLIVNVGSGVSIVLANHQSDGFKLKRVGGTSLGGGFFTGLAKLLVDQSNFETLLQMGKKGKNLTVDCTPQDFDRVPQELQEASVLFSLGKLTKDSCKQDIVRSLFYMVSFNIAQIALGYSDLYDLNNVIFTGFFCRNNTFMTDSFAQVFSFFQNNTKNMKKVISLKHDGYLGAIGALNYLFNEDKRNNKVNISQ